MISDKTTRTRWGLLSEKFVPLLIAFQLLHHLGSCKSPPSRRFSGNRGTAHLRLSLIQSINLFSICSCSLPLIDSANQLESYSYCQVNFYKQQSPSTCGLACITAILNYWGIAVSQDKLLMGFPPSSPDGYYIDDLMKMAKSEGLEAFVLQLPVSKLRLQIQKGRPVICGIKKSITDDLLYHFPLEGGLLGEIIRWLSPETNHFVVAVGFKDDRLLIMDPSIGLISLSEKKFESMHEKCNNIVMLAAKKQTNSQ